MNRYEAHITKHMTYSHWKIGDVVHNTVYNTWYGVIIEIDIDWILISGGHGPEYTDITHHPHVRLIGRISHENIDREFVRIDP